MWALSQKQKKRADMERTYPKLSILCWFFEENHHFLRIFLKPGTGGYAILKFFVKPDIHGSLILKTFQT
jgi:hypothetical protein